MTHYLHHVPGRLRVRSAAIKRNPAKAEAVQAALSELDGVLEVEVRPVTGSITVHYDGESCTMQDLVGLMKARGYIPASAPTETPNAAFDGLTPQTSQVARFVAGMAVEKVLERSATALIAALI